MITNMKTDMITMITPVAVLLTMISFGGCSPVQYHLPDHPGSYDPDGSMSDKWPDVHMKVGETIDAVTPAKGGPPGGYWHMVYVIDPSIAESVPVDGSFINGTKITAVAPGKTGAFYTNAGSLQDAYPNPDVEAQMTKYGLQPQFWIIVEE